MPDKNVLILGGGVAGLSAALELARFDISVELVEKTGFPGGHAIQFSCKATDKCVKCGACVAEEKLENVTENPKIRLMRNTCVEKVTKSDRFSVTFQTGPEYIDPDKCNGCGVCLEKCPSAGAVMQGFSKHHTPFYAICAEKCLFIKDGSCNVCQEACPEGAIRLDQKPGDYACEADAIIVATGFTGFDPKDKPYGYKVFPNVITNLEAERMLRQQDILLRPSDNKPAERIAFIQCVGSRDASLNHLWCSKICCGSSLRMARRIKARGPETEITFFYIDVQTFGSDFQGVYEDIREEFRMIRAIPGDIFRTDDDRLQMAFLDSNTREPAEEIFDLVVLSAGLTPGKDTEHLAGLLGAELADTGFFSSSRDGIFLAGAARGPMSIAESVASAGNAAWETVKYLSEK
ncbi:FAD-dependent oxidoreductase [Desulfococcaceae bacterium HSG8]|nr:FAD-dependent oxidoreductase [Desulfococcaceae bacterium HSG8]